MRTALTIFCATLGLLLLQPQARSASVISICDGKPGNLVMNCGFEASNFNDWTLLGNNVPGDLGNLYGVEGTDPTDGIAPNSGMYQAYFGTLDSNATMLDQTIATIAGMSYNFSFYLAQDTTPNTAHPQDENEVMASFGGTLVLNAMNVPVQPYTLMSYTLTATSASTVVSFTFGNGLGEFLLDDVQVSNAAPEPSAWLLFVIGAILAGAVYRKKRLAG